jgi:hypothetical protein
VTYSFEQFTSDLSAGRVNVWQLHRQGQRVEFQPQQVADAMSRAYIDRDEPLLSGLLELAQIYPDKRYTDVLCKVLEDPERGYTEMALDALDELMDPRSFDTLVRVASRADLAFDPTDWRKALDAIAGFYGLGLLEFEVVERALQQVAASGNILSRSAASTLETIEALKAKGGPKPK